MLNILRENIVSIFIYFIIILVIMIITCFQLHNRDKELLLLIGYSNKYDPITYYAGNKVHRLKMPKGFPMAEYTEIDMIAEHRVYGIFGKQGEKIVDYILVYEHERDKYVINTNNCTVVYDGIGQLRIPQSSRTKILISIVYAYLSNSPPHALNSDYTIEGFYRNWAYYASARLNDFQNSIFELAPNR